MSEPVCGERMGNSPRLACELMLGHPSEHLTRDWRYAYAWDGAGWAMRWATRHPMLHDEGAGL